MSDERGTLLGSSIGTDEHEVAALVMHDGIAQEWELWSMIIGRTALPRLERIRDALPTMTSAMLSTADGLNLCCLGVAQEDVGRLAALNSSLFAVSSAQAEIVSEAGVHPGQAMVSISTGHGHLVLVSFVQPPLGHLLLAVSAQEAQLGTMVVIVRRSAEEIRTWLSAN
ncbi:putative regulator of Ras-like GTPase activity (Roadblock/LC7/MglB family) [Kineosphaera limosa]|uniref:Roadblock/LAMTOR2 domain-containing protein n=1 Tax=Kineosphaera limosa NBRC 100340 TaxID=1184609 RepID=K6W7G0_9MICO|nr:hypothetical protein [Kineosphaera limosa]NYE02977.1 putative regulator of Ras-like GTPase activity (Roadblock/LC7/MglB family) [Kineosphaera limosa]GAB95130.1 hypothetical protein KILIM_016_00700 [Kineosphaera limosa NBRC 100340]